MPENLEAFFSEVEKVLGADGVNRSEETVRRYGENTMTRGDVRPSGVVYPRSTSDVQTIVQLANRCRAPLYPISTGFNIGLGSRSAARPGQVIVDLGYKMNRI